MPSSHKLIDDAVAYFIMPLYPGNFWHFLAEVFNPLFSVIRGTGRLHPAARNYLFYEQPLHLVPNASQVSYEHNR